MKLDFRWVEKKSTYTAGETLYLNRIRIGSYHWNSARAQGTDDDSTRYAGEIGLPSLSDKARRIYDSSPLAIKPKIEGVVTRWFKECLGKEANNV